MGFQIALGPFLGWRWCAHGHTISRGWDWCPNVSHHPTIGDIISNRYLKVMFKISKKGHLPTNPWLGRNISSALLRPNLQWCLTSPSWKKLRHHLYWSHFFGVAVPKRFPQSLGVKFPWRHRETSRYFCVSCRLTREIYVQLQPLTVMQSWEYWPPAVLKLCIKEAVRTGWTPMTQWLHHGFWKRALETFEKKKH